MKSIDLMNQNNNRGEAIKLLQAFCDKYDLSYSYGEKEFKVKLPYQEPLPVTPIGPATKTRKSFNIDDWGPKTIDESDLPDELPPADYTLDEGETPKGDDEV